jgi:beta-xylosidase
MNLQCRYKRTTFARPLRCTMPVGNWRYLLILIWGLLLLIPAGSGGQSWVKADTEGLRPLDRPISQSTDINTGIGHQPVWQSLAIYATAGSSNCNWMGWYPTGFGLKDHSIFTFGGFYYIASIRIPDEKAFAYARSTNLCNWEELGAVVGERIRGEWDEAYVWAPFVLEDNGVFYMYYTGVRRDFTQSIMLATSTNPADPGSWQRRGMIFQPYHDGMLWQKGRWADCRDASVLKVGDIYYMVYTGRDATGPIIGWASSFSPAGPWYDWGATLTLPQLDAMAESPTIISHEGAFYLLYNNTSQGEEYRIGATQIGPWSDAYPLPSGWANEIWIGQDGLDYTSFLHGYELMIGRTLWDGSYNPPHIFVRASTYRLFVPFFFNP